MKNDFTVEGLTEQQYWKLKRISKGIKLSGKLVEYVGSSNHSLISLWENNNAQMSEEKVKRYKAFIEAYPEQPKVD